MSLSELRALAGTACDREDLKRAALFSAMTGLRYSDIETLTWGEVYGEEGEHSLRFTQQKTNHVETLPISDNAFSLLGERGGNADRVFSNLAYSPWQTKKLKEWGIRAGITRPIHFHIFRHTFATLQLSMGTDLYTISKLLGHRNISTTQIYAKVIDQSKRDAVNKIKLTL